MRETERALTVTPRWKAVAPISGGSCETVHLSHTAVFTPGTARVEPMAHAQRMPSPMRQCWLLAEEPCCFEGVATIPWRLSLEDRALPTPTHHQQYRPPPPPPPHLLRPRVRGQRPVLGAEGGAALRVGELREGGKGRAPLAEESGEGGHEGGEEARAEDLAVRVHEVDDLGARRWEGVGTGPGW